MAADTAGSWVYTVAMTECGIATPILGTPDVTTGIAYYEYILYLNFDNTIESANGNGNLQQLGQTKLTCKGKVT